MSQSLPDDQMIEDGRTVCDVARELSVSQSSIYDIALYIYI